MRASLVLLAAILGLAATSCKKAGGERRADAGAATSRFSHPGTKEGARAVALEFARPGAHILSVFRALRPDAADYPAVFTSDVAEGVRAELDPIWDVGNVAMIVGPELSEILITGASVEELRAGATSAQLCPSAYKSTAKHMKPGVVIYCFKFVKPGETTAPVYDGLTYVNGHWAMFPKPFSAVKDTRKDAGIVEDDDD